MINYAGDLFAITGAQLDAKRGIYRLRCTYGDCKWKPFGQKLKESRSMAVAIPVLDSLLNCTAPTTEQAIEKKEEDLKCPICLETAKPPIFMCPDSHIICSTCAPKIRTCPECRVRLPTPLKRYVSLF